MKNDTKFDWRALGLAWRMGYTIAIPLVLLALGGRLIDRALNTSPIFLLIGILLSLVLSSIGIYRLVTPIFEDLSKPSTPKNDDKNPKE